MSDQPEDLLHAVVVTLLMPLFLPLLGDVDRARLAAAQAILRLQETIEADLLSIAQTIAFGIAVTNTLCLTMNEGLDARTVVRINASAAALSRCEARNRGTLTARKAPPARRKPAPPQTPPETPEEQAAHKAEGEKVRKMAQALQTIAGAAQYQAAQNPDKPLIVPDPFDKTKTFTINPDKLTWVMSYAQVAEDCVTDPDGFGEGSQKIANDRGKMMCSAAYDVLRGNTPAINPLLDLKARVAGGRSIRL